MEIEIKEKANSKTFWLLVPIYAIAVVLAYSFITTAILIIIICILTQDMFNYEKIYDSFIFSFVLISLCMLEGWIDLLCDIRNKKYNFRNGFSLYLTNVSPSPPGTPGIIDFDSNLEL